MKEGKIMSRKSMNLSQFNAFMKRCKDMIQVRYVTPTIHPRVKEIVAVTIYTADESKEFAITNNPDENFNLNTAVHEYLDSLGEHKGSTGHKS